MTRGPAGKTGRLRCEATTGSGDDEILCYRWEKQGPYRWSAIENGGTNEIVITAGARGISGVYECMVGNPRTGEKTISNQVLVQVELTCENLRYEEYNEPGIATAYKLAGKIVGGVPPYDVNTFQYRPNDHEYPVVRTWIYWTQEDSGDFEKQMNPIFCLMYDYVDTSHGTPYMGRADAYTFIVIRDSAGNRYESQPMKYGG